MGMVNYYHDMWPQQTLDHNKLFEIETDSSDYQLGGVIKQEGRPMAYYSRKLITVEKNILQSRRSVWLLLKSSSTFGLHY